MASRRRILVTIALSLVVPGAGHAYLRYWLRAITWFSIALATIALIVTESAITSPPAGGFDDLLQWSQEFPARVHLSILVASVLSAVDATILLLREDGRTTAKEEASTCPHCGNPLDDELDFCPWCTTRLNDDSNGNPTEDNS